MTAESMSSISLNKCVLLRIYWISPFSWALRSAAQNEFLYEDPAWAELTNVTAPECGGNCTVGQQALMSYDMPVESAWLVYGIVYEFGVFCVMVLVCAVGMQLSTPPQQAGRIHLMHYLSCVANV